MKYIPAIIREVRLAAREFQRSPRGARLATWFAGALVAMVLLATLAAIALRQ